MIKLAGANALIVVTAWLAAFLHERARGSDWRLLFLLAGVLAVGLAVNLTLLAIALRPIRELERTATRVWSGDLGARVPRSPLSDADLEHLATALNVLLDGLARDRNRVRELTAEIIRLGDRERALIARELHESLAQSLAGLGYHLGAVEQEAPNPGPSLMAAREIVSRLTTSVRNLAHKVYPQVLDDLGLVAGLRHLARNLATATTTIEVDVVDTSNEDLQQLSRDTAAVLYRVAEEGLRNAVRHAAARHITILLRATRNAASMAVQDDGVGFDKAGAVLANRGIGLFVLEERVALANGEFAVQSAPGKGTTIRVRIPVRRDTFQPVASPSIVGESIGGIAHAQ
jgi:signal transduction histidine kinase